MIQNSYIVTISVLHMDEYYTAARWPQMGDKAMLTPAGRTPGGSVANASSVCGALGGRVFFYDVLSRSEGNEFLLQDMEQYGIDTSFVNFTEEKIDSKCLIIVTGEEKTILCAMPRKPVMALGPEQAELFRNASVIYTMLGAEYIIPDTMAAFDDFKRHGARIALDVEFICESTEQRRFLEAADILFFNQFGFLQNRGDLEEEEYLEYLLNKGVDIIVVTLGGNGCRIKTRNEDLRIPVYDIRVRDTNGAGDTFNAAFLYGIQNHWTVKETGLFATAAANYCVTQEGPRGGAVSESIIRQFMGEHCLLG
ncbi:carbohydrate kinase family protein [Diplocloster hominis]|uniref:carbohydrate kinase family protein n=1 Tax=Diplocloster hominis TaxID=3079010 RepID=UPI0031B9ADF3